MRVRGFLLRLGTTARRICSHHSDIEDAVEVCAVILKGDLAHNSFQIVLRKLPAIDLKEKAQAAGLNKALDPRRLSQVAWVRSNISLASFNSSGTQTCSWPLREPNQRIHQLRNS